MSHVEAAARIDGDITSLKEKLDGLRAYLTSLEKGKVSPPSPPLSVPADVNRSQEVTRAVEIREFCDDDGHILDSQVVDISAECQSAGQAVMADRAERGANSAQAGGETERSGLSNDGERKEVRDKDGNIVTLEQIYEKLKNALNLPDSSSPHGSGGEGGDGQWGVTEEVNVSM